MKLSEERRPTEGQSSNGLMQLVFSPRAQPTQFNGIHGSLISPSSANQPPQSLKLILRAALAEHDNHDNESGRDYEYSEEFFKLDKSGVQDKENFSSVFSPIHSTTGDETEIVRADLNLQEESIQSEEDDEITEENAFDQKSSSKSHFDVMKARGGSTKSPKIKHAASMPKEAKHRSTSFPDKQAKSHGFYRAKTDCYEHAKAIVPHSSQSKDQILPIRQE